MEANLKRAARDCIQTRYAKLTNAIRNATPTSIGNDLIEVGMVSDAIIDFEPGLNKQGQASNIMKAVTNAVEAIPESIRMFIKVLCNSKDPTCRNFGEIMKEEMEKAGLTDTVQKLASMDQRHQSRSSGRDVEVDSNGSGSKAKEQPAGESNEEEEADGEEVDDEGDNIQRRRPKRRRTGPATDRTDGVIKQEGERFYKMDGRDAGHRRHGIALIINNIEWEKDENKIPYMLDRDGARYGADALKKSLEDIGYKVEVKENLTGDQMKEELKKARKLIDKADDSFICCISTHGDEDGVYGIDGRPRKRRPDIGGKHKPVPIKDLSEILEPDACKQLRRKPKIFFIQACRGTKVSEPTDDSSEEEPPVPPINFVPRGADYYFSYATDPGHLALRKDYPEYLSQALKKKLSLDEIVMSVHNKLAGRVATVRLPDDHLQIGQVVHTMRGPVYF